MEPEGEVDFTIKVVDAKRVKCPYCHREKGQRSYGRRGNVAYYRCTLCVLPDKTGDFTRYKVIFT